MELSVTDASDAFRLTLVLYIAQFRVMQPSTMYLPILYPFYPPLVNDTRISAQIPNPTAPTYYSEAVFVFDLALAPLWTLLALGRLR